MGQEASSALQMALLLLLSSTAGISLAAMVRWREAARVAGVAVAVGIGLGPILAGLTTIAVLWLLPGSARALHLAVVIVVLAALALAGSRGLRESLKLGWCNLKSAPLTLLAVTAFGLLLLLELVYAPLTQNDALEYATVARLLFETRDLGAYPAIHPEATSSGFFGPWTHPPLYVAQIYLADLVQGNAQSARAMRLIAPWCLLAAAACVVALGSMRSRTTGLIAGALLLSTPMLLLGASGALIDPLPVLGVTLVFCGLLGLAPSTINRGAGVGVLLGFALWTHSQAVLFPFLLLPLLWFGCSERLTNTLTGRLLGPLPVAAIAMATAVLVGVWPYLRNLVIFGSAISDNPAVYALPELQFNRYFALQRGFSGPTATAQYGILKGLFSIESYSVLFWLGLVGVPLAWRSLRESIRRPSDSISMPDGLPAAALTVVVLYLLATLASVLAGTDLMVRNDRYLLVLTPCVALLAAAGVIRLWGLALVRRTRLLQVVLILAVAAMPLQLVLAYSRQSAVRIGIAAWDEPAQLKAHSQFDPSRYLAAATPNDALVLSMRPADMFYSERKMISYLDPRMLPFYRQQSDDQVAFALLRQLGITHVQVTDYLLPPVYRSRLMSILAHNPESRLLQDFGAYQIYDLTGGNPESSRLQPATFLRPDDSGWQRETRIALGGAKSRLSVTVAIEPYRLSSVSINDRSFGIFLRELRTVLVAPPVSLEATQRLCAASGLDLELVVSASLRGDAYVYLLASSEVAGLPRTRLLADAAVGDASQAAVVERRFRPGRDARHIKLSLLHNGSSWLSIDELIVTPQCARS